MSEDSMPKHDPSSGMGHRPVLNFNNCVFIGGDARVGDIYVMTNEGTQSFSAQGRGNIPKPQGSGGSFVSLRVKIILEDAINQVSKALGPDVAKHAIGVMVALGTNTMPVLPRSTQPPPAVQQQEVHQSVVIQGDGNVLHQTVNNIYPAEAAKEERDILPCDVNLDGYNGAEKD